ncbi:unnamed protein product [Prunus armeniaca]
MVEFSPTSRAERQTRTVGSSLTSCVERQAGTCRVFTYTSCRTAGAPGLVFTHLLCRTAGTHGSSFHSPLPADSLPIFKPTSWLEDLGDYMIIPGLQTTDARSRVRMPELRDKQVLNQEVLP